MGGLGFIHLGFLAAGAAVAVPIVIHLLFRQRARRVEIGTLHFLRVVLRDQARRRKIRRWLLLALRAAGVLLLALLFARPFWRAPETLGSEREVVILIDRSASMAAGTAGATPFDKAQRQAAELDRGPARWVHGPPGVFRRRRGRSRPEGEDRPRDAPGPGRHRLHQGARLGPRHRRRVAAAEAAGVSRDRPSALRHRSAAGRWLSAGRGNRADRRRPSADDEPRRRGRAGRTDRPQGRQAGRPSRPASSTPASFPLAMCASACRSRASRPSRRRCRSTAIPASSYDSKCRSTSPGLYHGFVEVAARDDLPFDNRRWLAFQARRPDRVLLIDGEPGPSVFGNETYYLETALRLRLPGDEPAASASPYEPTRVPGAARGVPCPI